ncbi:MAG: hypothetical protein AAB114_02850, partial [Chloroflexota bacterium]
MALLYAYRAQTPVTKELSIGEAIHKIESGQVKVVTVTGNKATIELADGGTKYLVTLQDRDEVFVKRA